MSLSWQRICESRVLEKQNCDGQLSALFQGKQGELGLHGLRFRQSLIGLMGGHEAVELEICGVSTIKILFAGHAVTGFLVTKRPLRCMELEPRVYGHHPLPLNR